jgi:hypothetical protein
VEFEWKLFRDSDENGEIVFRHVALPGDDEVARVTERVCRQVSKLLDRRGLGPQTSHEEPDALQHSQPLLAELYGASISGRAATGRRAGRRVGKVGDTIDWEDSALPAVPLGLRAFLGLYLIEGPSAIKAPKDEESFFFTRPLAYYRHNPDP